VKKFKRKNREIGRYAYLVENKWYKRRKGARQKVKAFLGRVYQPSLANDVGFFEHFKIQDIDNYVKEKNVNDIKKDLIAWEFFKHNIKEGEFFIGFSEKIIRKYNNKAVIKMNEGYLCDYTLRKLINFRFKAEEEHAGMALAKVFVDAGLQIPQELFVRLFEKIS